MECIQKSHSVSPSGNYIPRGRTVLHTILDNHFNSFVENYDSKYAEECGKYSLERISSVVEEYLKCGDYFAFLKNKVKKSTIPCRQPRSIKLLNMFSIL